MDIPTQAQLIANIERFLARHEMAETRFGREAVNNPNFLRGLRENKSPTLETLGRIDDFMARADEAAITQAKLHSLPPAREEEEIALPFSAAPVNPTGASSPTSSRTAERLPLPEGSASCPSCSVDEAQS